MCQAFSHFSLSREALSFLSLPPPPPHPFHPSVKKKCQIFPCLPPFLFLLFVLLLLPKGLVYSTSFILRRLVHRAQGLERKWGGEEGSTAFRSDLSPPPPPSPQPPPPPPPTTLSSTFSLLLIVAFSSLQPELVSLLRLTSPFIKRRRKVSRNILKKKKKDSRFLRKLRKKIGTQNSDSAPPPPFSFMFPSLCHFIEPNHPKAFLKKI